MISNGVLGHDAATAKVVSTANDVGSPGDDIYTGAGVIDLDAALSAS